MFTSSTSQVVMGPDALIFVFMNVEFSARFFTLPIHPLHFLFVSMLPIIYISEGFGVSPSNRDASF